MKYSRLRTALLTFTLGLFSVSLLSPLYETKIELPIDLTKVDLPQTESASPIIVVIDPTGNFFRTRYGGGGAGGGGSGGASHGHSGYFASETVTNVLRREK